MNVIIGDIGNTVTKICLIDNHSLKLKKEIYFDSKQILLKKFLKKKNEKYY